MKKRILALFVAMTLVFAYAVPVAATEAEETVTETTVTTEVVHEDPLIQEIYEAYKVLEALLPTHDYEAIQVAYDTCNDLTYKLTEEQEEEMTRCVEEEDEWEDFLGVLFEAGRTLYLVDERDAYTSNPNAKTAYDFIAAYDESVEYEWPVTEMVPGIDEVYEAAKADMASESVINVYECHAVFSDEMHYCEAYLSEDFLNAFKTFEGLLDTFNELTEAELSDLALLMGVADGEAAFNQILSDWILANVIMEIAEIYNAFNENPNVETAQALVEKYDAVFYSGTFSESEESILLCVFWDLRDKYDEAKAMLSAEEPTTEEPTTEAPVTEEPAPEEPVADEPATTEPEDIQTDGTDIEEPTTDAEKADNTPTTGDESNMIVPFVVLIAAAGVAFATLRRRTE